LFQQQLESLIAWATAPDRQEELLRARTEFFERAGQIWDDDKSFEPRMGAFLEYWLFDRRLDGTATTPAEAYLVAAPGPSPEERVIFEGFTRTLHAVFEIRKLGTAAGVRVRELWSGTDYEVFERRGVVGLAKGDLLDARLIPFEDKLMFSNVFLYHPREARKAILKEVKRRKKAGDPATPGAFAWELARMALKLERYRNVAVENIYRFDLAR
jgi:hypothetical protein